MQRLRSAKELGWFPAMLFIMQARVIALVTNIPGPLAVSRLAELGAQVTKIEPPEGDPLGAAAPQWYARIVQGMRVVRYDVKDDENRSALGHMLQEADLLVTSMRSSALVRAGLDWNDLHRRFPDLCHVAILGEAPPNDDRAGHDLTYQARAGLLAPPSMPRTVFADLFAAERAVSAALIALYERDRTGTASRHDVAIAQGAAMLADAVRYGLTSSAGPLSGTSSTYRLYRTSDGWIAVAALEPHFQTRLLEALDTPSLEAEALEAHFRRNPNSYWESLAETYDLPLAPVTEP